LYRISANRQLEQKTSTTGGIKSVAAAAAVQVVVATSCDAHERQATVYFLSDSPLAQVKSFKKSRPTRQLLALLPSA
jgi:hypothetical protein